MLWERVVKEQVAVSSGGGTAGGGMVADQDWWGGAGGEGISGRRRVVGANGEGTGWCKYLKMGLRI